MSEIKIKYIDGKKENGMIGSFFEKSFKSWVLQKI